MMMMMLGGAGGLRSRVVVVAGRSYSAVATAKNNVFVMRQRGGMSLVHHGRSFTTATATTATAPKEILTVEQRELLNKYWVPVFGVLFCGFIGLASMGSGPAPASASSFRSSSDDNKRFHKNDWDKYDQTALKMTDEDDDEDEDEEDDDEDEDEEEQEEDSDDDFIQEGGSSSDDDDEEENEEDIIMDDQQQFIHEASMEAEKRKRQHTPMPK